MKSLLILVLGIFSVSIFARPIERACERNFYGNEVDRCIRIANRRGLRAREVRRCRTLSCLRQTARDNRRDDRDYRRPRPRPVPQPAPIPRDDYNYEYRTYSVKPNFSCLRNMRPVDHADRLVSDGFFSRFVGQLADCESDRRDYSYRNNSNCSVQTYTLRRTESCYRDIKSLVRGGTITSTHRSFFRQACSEYVYTCKEYYY